MAIFGTKDQVGRQEKASTASPSVPVGHCQYGGNAADTDEVMPSPRQNLEQFTDCDQVRLFIVATYKAAVGGGRRPALHTDCMGPGEKAVHVSGGFHV